MGQYSSGILNPYESLNANVLPRDVFGVAINYFVNRTPLLSRLNKSACGATSFITTNDSYRPSTTTLSSNIDNAVTTVPVADGSSYMIGDVFEIDSEAFLVTADPAAGNSLTVTRAYGGTTAAAHTSPAVVYLITNTRTGSEVDVNGISRKPSPIEQFLQNFQHPYAVGGSMQAKTNLALPPGVASVVGREQLYAMQNCADDFERSAYYGYGVGIASGTTRPAQKGLRALITSNKTTSPTNASAYKPTDLIRDTTEKIYSGGGDPSLMLVASNFMSGLATWGHAAQRIEVGSNAFGTPIDTFKVPFLGDIELVVAPHLRSGTVICLSADEVMIRMGRDMHDKPRGSRGDATEGDILMEGAIQLNNEQHHAWVSGITAFSAT